MDLDSFIQNYKVYIILAGGVFALLTWILLIVQRVKISKLNKKYKSFLQGNDGKSLEELILGKFDEMETLKQDVDATKNKLIEVSDVLSSTYQKMGMVKYDAFKEMGGKLSFALALLDDKNSGVIINSMHSSREGCYTYAKEIIHGESFVVLSEEEKEALNAALNKKNYME